MRGSEVTHGPFSTLMERIFLKSRSKMFGHSMVNWQHFPWKCSSSNMVMLHWLRPLCSICCSGFMSAALCLCVCASVCVYNHCAAALAQGVYIPHWPPLEPRGERNRPALSAHTHSKPALTHNQHTTLRASETQSHSLTQLNLWKTVCCYWHCVDIVYHGHLYFVCCVECDCVVVCTVSVF